MPALGKKATVRPVASVVPYTLQSDGSMALFFWRNQLHTPLQSARFFHDLVIPSPPVTGEEEWEAARADRDHLLRNYLDQCTQGAFGDLRKRFRHSKAILRLQRMLWVFVTFGVFKLHCLRLSRFSILLRSVPPEACY